ncbi:hypothetical protein [Pseudoxanthomonas sp. X-1]|uniref:hypothetical protein n=1 Tax=Pseudoxanthomonas sp. X-1 TaxID=2571115 RepID=UPI00110B3A23|nr:hypothetical protein [Pseudoxanthomonas sp. X-1]TMN25100.1 hypothetical protein FF950_02950 [Pseudoxanthomonas sp. X-1]UAY74884.1 hypothetical protein LAJ50_00995 [Pseudoxanthomonas sp. X-1]
MVGKQELIEKARNPWWQAAAAVALLALVITTALGGFGDASGKPHPLPRSGADTTLRSGAMAVTPRRTWLAHYRPGGRVDPADPQALYLVLEADIENLTGRSVNGYGFLREDVVLVDARGEPTRPDVLQLADDHSTLTGLQPRLRQRVELVWSLPAGTAVPAQPLFGLFARDYVAKAYLNDQGGWMQGAPMALMQLPLRDLRDRVVAP